MANSSITSPKTFGVQELDQQPGNSKSAMPDPKLPIPKQHFNMNASDIENTSSEKNDSGVRQLSWYRDPGLRKLYALLAVCVLTSASNGFDGTIMNGLQSVSYWESYFGNPAGPRLGLLNAVQPIGAIVGLPLVPYVADGRGRKFGIILGSAVMMIGIALQSSSQNFEMFLCARFLIGFGIAIAQGTAPLLLAELAHPRHRGKLSTLYNTIWYVGAIIAAGITLGTFKVPSNWSWRIPSILQAFPSIIQFTFIWFVPESPRWLISKGKDDKAREFFVRYHANGDANNQIVQSQYDQVKETLELEQIASRTGWAELYATPANRRRIIIVVCLGIFSQWSGNGLISYYLPKVLENAGIHNSGTQLQINLGLSCWNGFVAVSFAFGVDRFGRRPLFLISVFGMLGSFIVWTICSSINSRTDSASSSIAIVSFIFIFYTFYNIAFSGLVVGYTVEILPYKIRAKGLTIMNVATQLAIFVNVFVNPIGLRNIGWKYYLVYCVWLGVECIIIYFFFIETAGASTLEDIAALFGDKEQQPSAKSSTSVINLQPLAQDLGVTSVFS
jgi:sugar porter (SP) family MFS transporter